MLLEKKRILHLKFTTDRSESVFFTQGGRIDFKIIKSNYDDEDSSNAILLDQIKDADEIIFSFQIDHEHLADFKWIVQCANQHLNTLTPEEQEARKRDAEQWEKDKNK